MPTEIKTDTANQFGWASKTIVTDADRNVLRTVIEYDNGNRYEEVFDPDTSYLTTTYYDLADLAPYRSKSETLFVDPETGATSEINPATGEEIRYLIASTRVNDDGTTIVYDYFLNKIVQTDPENAHPWSRIETTNAIHGGSEPPVTITTYDDGTYLRESTTGSLEDRRLFSADGEVLEAETTIYDEDGRIAEYGVVDYMTGTSTVWLYDGDRDAGILEARGEAGPTSWTDRRTFFDEDGDVFVRFTVFKNGVQREENFTNGQVTDTTDHDFENVQTWTTLTNTYNPDGSLASRVTTFDSGLERTDTFENGQRVARSEVDLTDTKAWSSVTIRYDEDGQLSERTIANDNGITTTDVYESGQRVGRTKVDVDDVKAWARIFQTYDAGGDLQNTETRMDDGDVIVQLAEQNARLHWDGNDSSSWDFKVTEVDESNAKSTTNYTNLEDVPEEYAGFFVDILTL